MRKKFWFRLSCAVIIIFLIFIGHSAISIWSFSNQVQYVKTDAAVVLGAAVWGNEPSPVFRERINHAIWLYKNDYVDKIIFTGGKSKGDEFAESEAAREYAIQNDVNEEDIFIETKSKITEENLKYAYEIANENHLKSFTIVSDPLHMKRALFIAETIGMEAYSSPTPSSVYKTFGSKLPFFLRELFYYVGYIVTLLFR